MALTLTLALGACASDSSYERAQARRLAGMAMAGRTADAAHEPDPAPIHDVTQVGLSAVWGSAADDVWVVGADGVILHSDGKRLEVVPSTTSRSLHAIDGTGPQDIWAVGDEGTTLHWNGVRFEFVERWQSETFLGVKAIAPDNVWVVGLVPGERVGLVRHYDGDKWTGTEVPGSTSLWEVWSSGPDDIWFVGTALSITGLVFRGDGMDFKQLDFQGQPLRDVWGSSAEDVWLLPYDSAPQHWNGESFSVDAEDPAPDGMLGTWGSAPDDVWAVGLHGTLRHFDGAHWELSEPLVDEPLWSVWGNARDDVWAVGGAGTMLRWNGDHWRVFASSEATHAQPASVTARSAADP